MAASRVRGMVTAALALLVSGISTGWCDDGDLIAQATGESPRVNPTQIIIRDRETDSTYVIPCQQRIVPGVNQLDIWGYLFPINEAEGWAVAVQETCNPYVLEGIERFEYWTWFTPGRPVRILGRPRLENPNEYKAGVPIHVQDIQPIW